MTQYVSDLQDLANEWGKAFSKHYGTTCKWVDLHAKRSEMEKYKKYKISAKSENARYEGQGDSLELPGIVTTDSVNNDSSVQQSVTFKYSKTTTSSFTWTLKEGIKVGIKVEFAVGVPPVASAKTTLSTEMSFEATQSKTESESVTWSIDRNVVIPPRSEMDMIWTIKQKAVSAKFYADIILGGYFAIWNKDKIDVNRPGGNDKHWLWFIPITHAFSEMTQWGIFYPSAYSVLGDSMVYKASGDCIGEAGLSTTFRLKQSPLTTGVKAALPQAPQQVTIIEMSAIPGEQ